MYDYQNNLFYSFKHSTAAKLEAFTLANFKKGGASSGFAKDYLEKRIKTIKSVVYGDEPLNDPSKPQPHQLNLIQRIMKNVTTPVLINHSRSVVSTQSKSEEVIKYQRVLILSQIYKACATFDMKMEEVTSQKKSASELEDHMMTFFKFPSATYLTHTVFQQIQENLDHTTHLIDGQKTSANLADQYSLYLMLKILTANFKALSFCSISLPDIMDEEAYQKFLNAYRSCIVKIIESGYTQDFEEGNEEIRALWVEIYQMSLSILSTSINLIYSNINDIVVSLESTLGSASEHNDKQAENSSISLNYLSSSENAKKLLQGDEAELKVLVSVFEHCCKVKSADLSRAIKA